MAFDEEATVSIPSIAPDDPPATVLPVHIEEEEHADDEADDDEEDDAHAEESQSAQPSDNHADRSHRGTMAKEPPCSPPQRRRPRDQDPRYES